MTAEHLSNGPGAGKFDIAALGAAVFGDGRAGIVELWPIPDSAAELPALWDFAERECVEWLGLENAGEGTRLVVVPILDVPERDAEMMRKKLEETSSGPVVMWSREEWSARMLTTK